MQASALCAALEKEFIKPDMSDDWKKQTSLVEGFLCDSYKRRWMGLVCDFAKRIDAVYTAVFPSDAVMKAVLRQASDAMLFVHHPATWDVRNAPRIWTPMNAALLEKFRKQRISIYNLHVPLDNYGEYSTSVTLAKKLGLSGLKRFAPFFGGYCGVIGNTHFRKVSELVRQLQDAVGHPVKRYCYGAELIKDGRVAVIAGGGNNTNDLGLIAEEGINTFVTGITLKNDYSREVHDFEKKHRINLLGATHYSTEKFACAALCEWFRKQGLECNFIPDKPVMEDM